MAEAAPAAEKSLPELYAGWVSLSINAVGVALPNAFQRSASGCLEIYALALSPAEAYDFLLTRWIEERPLELMFAFDRFAMPGQGTTLSDCMAGMHIVGVESRPFIIEYQHQPRIVKPIAWDNVFWNAALRREFAGATHKLGLI